MHGRNQRLNTPYISDAELISQCLAGHKEAWEILISRYERLIYHTAFRTGIDAQEVDEVFQNVCVIWVKELKQLRDGTRLGAWLVTTTRRECWSIWKRRKVGEQELDEQLVFDESPEKLAAQVEDANIIQAAFGQLGEPCHRLLKLLYFDPDPRSYAEIAQEIDIPINSIGPTRARCLEKLKAMLKRFNW